MRTCIFTDLKHFYPLSTSALCKARRKKYSPSACGFLCLEDLCHSVELRLVIPTDGLWEVFRPNPKRQCRHTPQYVLSTITLSRQLTMAKIFVPVTLPGVLYTSKRNWYAERMKWDLLSRSFCSIFGCLSKENWLFREIIWSTWLKCQLYNVAFIIVWSACFSHLLTKRWGYQLKMLLWPLGGSHFFL